MTGSADADEMCCTSARTCIFASRITAGCLSNSSGDHLALGIVVSGLIATGSRAQRRMRSLCYSDGLRFQARQMLSSSAKRYPALRSTSVPRLLIYIFRLCLVL